MVSYERLSAKVICDTYWRFNNMNIVGIKSVPMTYETVGRFSVNEEPFEPFMTKLGKCKSPNLGFTNLKNPIIATNSRKTSLIKVTDSKKIEGLPRRPYLADASASTVFSGISLGLLTASSGIESVNQKQSLELAIRGYFKTQNLEVIFFNRAARLARVSFSYAPNAYWTIESVMPDSVKLDSKEDIDDWLYGNLTVNELPNILEKIKIHGNK
jgi:hypothetical protein